MTIRFAAWLACSVCFALAGCAAGPSQEAPAVDLQGEQLSITSSSDDTLTGLFRREGQSLGFSVQTSAGVSELRLTSASGELLYLTRSSQDGYELQAGASFRSFLPARPGASVPWERNDSPAGFEVHGDLSQALDALKASSLTLLPYLSAALGRAGYDGAKSRLGMTIHLTAMQLAEQGFSLSREVVHITNQTLTGETPANQVPEGVDQASSALSLDYSKTVRCNSGVARRFFGTTLDGDPCRDQCFGMCGPECTPWTWLCGDRAVHATCWQHDSAYCPTSIGSVAGIPIPNPGYPVCMTEYAAYSAYIATEAQAGLCEDSTSVPLGLSRSHPGFYTEYGHYTATEPGGTQAPVQRGYPVFNAGVASQSSDFPGYDGYPHDAARARDHARAADGSFDGNFYHGTTSATNAGFVPDYRVPTSSPYRGQYWMLDMGALKQIYWLDIATRTDYAPGPLQDIVVLTWVGSGSIGWKLVADAAGAQLSNRNAEHLVLPEGTVSQYVLIQKKNDSALTLAEVTVVAGSAD
jgi:hypothetical protein